VTGLYLALDTATDVPSLALGTAEAPGEDLRVPSRRELSREIERAAARLLAARNARARDVSGVVVADGPGSFTGLRIGTAFAKGLCRATGVPLLAGPSLLGAARAAARGRGVALAEYDALRGDVYRAAYRFSEGGVEVLFAPALATAGSLVALPEGYVRATAADASASSLLRLLAVAGAVATVADPSAWEPAYGRPAEAEARYRARGGLRVGGADGAKNGFGAR
jgi:tRNA threonylcarbamoyl adenosine modification protein YeaZ